MLFLYCLVYTYELYQDKAKSRVRRQRSSDLLKLASDLLKKMLLRTSNSKPSPQCGKLVHTAKLSLPRSCSGSTSPRTHDTDIATERVFVINGNLVHQLLLFVPSESSTLLVLFVPSESSTSYCSLQFSEVPFTHFHTLAFDSSSSQFILIPIPVYSQGNLLWYGSSWGHSCAVRLYPCFLFIFHY